MSRPLQHDFTYEVRLYITLPMTWATLLKTAAYHHYDHLCNDIGDHGVINGLFNTAYEDPCPSGLAVRPGRYPVSARDLDLTLKVAEQLENHTSDHTLTAEIRTWLRETMHALEVQRLRCLKLNQDDQAPEVPF